MGGREVVRVELHPWEPLVAKVLYGNHSIGTQPGVVVSRIALGGTLHLSNMWNTGLMIRPGVSDNAPRTCDRGLRWQTDIAGIKAAGRWHVPSNDSQGVRGGGGYYTGRLTYPQTGPTWYTCLCRTFSCLFGLMYRCNTGIGYKGSISTHGSSMWSWAFQWMYVVYRMSRDRMSCCWCWLYSR